MKKKILLALGIPLASLLLVISAYLIYVLVAYYRLEDNLPLAVENKAEKKIASENTFSLITYNIGFAAYSDTYSFFMDGGEYARAFSEEAVFENLGGMANALEQENADFILLQEVDIRGTRSYGVNQKDFLGERFGEYDLVFAQNYDSPYFLYPFHQPIGKNKSGLVTLSRFPIESATRKSLPVEDSFSKYLDLDRAYSVSVLSLENGKTLSLYNVHLSAYTSDGTISEDQMRLLAKDMQAQYNAGHYVIAAGDFNKDLLSDSSLYFARSEGEFNWAAPFDTSLLPKHFSLATGKNAPTCRNADSPFRGDGTDFVLSVDGFLTSDNVEILSSETLDLRFAYSDHNPVKLTFRFR